MNKTTGILLAAVAACTSTFGVVGTARAGAQPGFDPTGDATFNCDNGDLFITVSLANGAGSPFSVFIENADGVLVDKSAEQDGDTVYGPFDDGDYHVIIKWNDVDYKFAMVEPVMCSGGVELTANCTNGDPALGIGIYDEQNWSYNVTIDETLVGASVGSNAKGTYTNYWPVAVGTHHVRVDWLQSNIDQPLFDDDVNISACAVPAEPEPTTPAPTTPAEQQASDATLPTTGSDDTALLFVAAGLLVAGYVLVTTTGRRAANARGTRR